MKEWHFRNMLPILAMLELFLLTSCSGVEQQKHLQSSVNTTELLEELNMKSNSLDSYNSKYKLGLLTFEDHNVNYKDEELQAVKSELNFLRSRSVNLSIINIKKEDFSKTIIKTYGVESGFSFLRLKKSDTEVFCTQNLETITCRKIDETGFTIKLDSKYEQALADINQINFVGGEKINGRQCYKFSYTVTEENYNDFMSKFYSYLGVFIINRTGLKSNVEICLDKEFGYINSFELTTVEGKTPIQAIQIKATDFLPETKEEISVPAPFTLTNLECSEKSVNFTVIGLKSDLVEFNAAFNDEKFEKFIHDIEFGKETKMIKFLKTSLKKGHYYHLGKMCGEGFCSSNYCQYK